MNNNFFFFNEKCGSVLLSLTPIWLQLVFKFSRFFKNLFNSISILHPSLTISLSFFFCFSRVLFQFFLFRFTLPPPSLQTPLPISTAPILTPLHLNTPPSQHPPISTTSLSTPPLPTPNQFFQHPPKFYLRKILGISVKLFLYTSNANIYSVVTLGCRSHVGKGVKGYFKVGDWLLVFWVVIWWCWWWWRW